MYEKMPSQEEQDMVALYVLKRPLARPNTSIKKAFVYVALFVAVNLALIISLYHVFNWLGIFNCMPSVIIQFKERHNIAFFTLFGLAVILSVSIIVSKRAIIGAIRLYQRYAPEDIRRRCLFKPTCSEYSILAIKKYGVVFGLVKTYNRLFKRCKGRIYRVDYP